MKSRKKHRPAKRRPGSVPAPVPAIVPPPAEPSDPDREFVCSLDSLFRSFRMKACEVWSRARLSAVCARTVTRLQTNFPGYDPAALTPDTAAAVFDTIEAILDEAPWWHRRALRREAMNLLAELYNKSYETLRAHSALEKVEQLYLSVKE